MQDANSYGTVDFAHEQDAFLTPTRRQSHTSLATWGKVAVGAAAAIAGLGYCVSVQSSLQAQQDTIALMQQQMYVHDALSLLLWSSRQRD